jgi:hypothetical protein
LDAPNVGLHLHFDNIARFGTRKRRKRLAVTGCVKMSTHRQFENADPK